MRPDDVVAFWFDEIPESSWWRKDPAFDAALGQRFGEVHAAALAGELWDWRAAPAGRLAEVVVLDQFSRNLHRGTARAFAGDGMALVLAQEAISAGAAEQLSSRHLAVLYMPFMHAESRLVQRRSVELFTALGSDGTAKYATAHARIVERFGRFPHRNAILGRTSTPEEEAFLREEGSSF